MTWIAAAATVASAVIGSSASRSAANTQARSAERAAQLQKEMFDKQVEMLGPYTGAGQAGTNRLLEYLGIGGDPNAQGYGSLGGGFTMERFNEDPFYQYSLNQGIKDLERTAAARGGLLSGNTIRGYKTVQGKEYENAFNRYFTNRSNTLAPYAGLMNTGVNAVGTLSGAAQNYASGAGDAYMGAGNARASGYIGSANALTNAIGQYLDQRGNDSYRSYLDKVLPEYQVTSRRPGG
jgi:hypothetical protein